MSDPRNDRVFKLIFQHHPRALRNLLNSFLPLESPIVTFDYMPMELQSDLSGLHMAIVDVRCRDSAGRHFIVEMQLQKKPHFFRRVLMNACRIYSRQGGRGDGLKGVYPVYTLCLLDHILYPDDPDWLHHLEPCVPGSHLKRTGEIHFTFVEMRKWMKTGKFDVDDIRDTWMLFFTKPEKMKDVFTPEQRKRYEELWEAVDAWDLSRYTERELWVMDKQFQDMWTHESYVEIYRDEGREAGLQQGLEQGREQGREEGLEDGRREGRDQGLREGLELGLLKGLEDGRQKGFDDGVEGVLGALQHLKENPSVTDGELMVRFRISEESLKRVRAMLQG